MKRILLNLSVFLTFFCVALRHAPALADGVPVFVYTDAAKPSGNTCLGSATRVQAGGCSLLSSTTPDAALLAISGASFATVNITFGAGVATSPSSTIAYSIDGGVNFVNSGAGAPYVKDITTLNSSPTTTAFATKQTNGITWELPLASNVTHVKVLVATTGTTVQTVNLVAGKAYVSGQEYKAILYDVSTTAGANNNTGILETGGWKTVQAIILVTTAATGTAAINYITSTGTAVAINSIASLAINNYTTGLGAYTSVGSFGAAGSTNPVYFPVPRRTSVTTTGATTSAQQVIVEVTR